MFISAPACIKELVLAYIPDISQIDEMAALDSDWRAAVDNLLGGPDGRLAGGKHSGKMLRRILRDDPEYGRSHPGLRICPVLYANPHRMRMLRGKFKDELISSVPLNYIIKINSLSLFQRRMYHTSQEREGSQHVPLPFKRRNKRKLAMLEIK